MLPTAIQYFAAFAVTILLVFITGRSLLACFKFGPLPKFFRLFSELLLGLSALVLLYSLAQTGLKTVNILFVLFLVFTFLFFRKAVILSFPKFDFSLRHFAGDVLMLLILGLPFFVYECFFLLKSGEFNFKIPEVDYFFYSNLSELLNLTGRENKFFSSNILYADQYEGIVPYHYFESWLNAIIIRLFSLPSISALLLVTFPVLYLCILTGIIALWENLGTVTGYRIVVCYLLFLLSGLYLHVLDFSITPPITGPTMSSLLSNYGRKLSPVYLFYIFSLILFLKNKIFWSVIVLSLVMIISVGTLPGLLGGVTLFLVTNFYHRSLHKKEIIVAGTYYFVFASAYFLLYRFFGTSYTNEYVMHNNVFAKLLEDPVNISLYKFLLSHILDSFLVLSISYLPYLAVIAAVVFLGRRMRYIPYNERIFKAGLLLLFTLVSGSVAAGLANGLLDSNQLYNNLYPLLNAWLAALFILYLDHIFKQPAFISVKKYGVVLFLLLLTSACNIHQNVRLAGKYYKRFSKYSDAYISAVLGVMKNQKTSMIGVYLLSEENYREVDYVKIYRKRPGYFIQYLPGYWDLVDISFYKIYDQKKELPYYDKYWLKNNDFSYFVTLQKAKHAFISYEKSQLDFIDAFNIDYAFASENAVLSPKLRQSVAYEIIDEYSGERFMYFKNE